MSREEGDDPLRLAWRRALADLGVARDDAALDDLLRRYRQPHRHYHTVEHLAHVVRGVESMSKDCDDAPTTILAAFFHDAVYEIGAADNEAASADLAAAVLQRWGTQDVSVQRVTALVLATADHRLPPGGPADAAVLIDADLAILAADERRYARYVDDVRREYQSVPEEAWRVGRAAVLESFLDRDGIFLTARGRGWDDAARRNLSHELGLLRS